MRVCQEHGDLCWWDVKQRNISTPKVTNITMIDRQKQGLE